MPVNFINLVSVFDNASFECIAGSSQTSMCRVL